jgi:hypothetical protein
VITTVRVTVLFMSFPSLFCAEEVSNTANTIVSASNPNRFDSTSVITATNEIQRADKTYLQSMPVGEPIPHEALVEFHSFTHPHLFIIVISWLLSAIIVVITFYSINYEHLLPVKLAK